MIEMWFSTCPHVLRDMSVDDLDDILHVMEMGLDDNPHDMSVDDMDDLPRVMEVGPAVHPVNLRQSRHFMQILPSRALPSRRRQQDRGTTAGAGNRGTWHKRP